MTVPRTRTARTVLGSHAVLPHDVLIALSDERDRWQRRLAAAEQRASRAYDQGFAAGQRLERDLWFLYLDEQHDRIRSAGLPVPDGVIRLEIRRWAPKGWRGQVPAGMGSAQRRLWLAHLPRKGGDFTPSPARFAGIRARWDAAVKAAQS